MRSRAKQGNRRQTKKIKNAEGRVIGYESVQRPAFGSLRGNKRRAFAEAAFAESRREFQAQEARRARMRELFN